MTATDSLTLAYSCDDIERWQNFWNPDSWFVYREWGCENETLFVNPVLHTYHHGELNFHAMNAVRGTKIYPYDNPPFVNADNNNDLLVSMKEVWNYEKGWDSRQHHPNPGPGSPPTNPSYSDVGNIGPSTFLGWDDGEAPARPTDLRDTCNCSTAGPCVILNWNDNTEPDKVGYWTYRDGNRIAATYDSRYVDSDVEEAVYAYEVTAFDLCGNQSVPESVKVSLICGDPNADGTIAFTDALYIKNFYYQMPPGSPPPHCPPEPYSCCGDVNVDEKLDFADALYIKNYVYQTPPGSPAPLSEGDVNLDGRITFADALYIKNYYYQTPPGSPAPCNPP